STVAGAPPYTHPVLINRLYCQIIIRITIQTIQLVCGIFVYHHRVIQLVLVDTVIQMITLGTLHAIPAQMCFTAVLSPINYKVCYLGWTFTPSVPKNPEPRDSKVGGGHMIIGKPDIARFAGLGKFYVIVGDVLLAASFVDQCIPVLCIIRVFI